jgi:hypothetical protein
MPGEGKKAMAKDSSSSSQKGSAPTGSGQAFLCETQY